MFAWIASGMIIFRESDYYSKKQALIILGSVFMCLIGIYFLLTKKKLSKEDEKETSEFIKNKPSIAGEEFKAANSMQ